MQPIIPQMQQPPAPSPQQPMQMGQRLPVGQPPVTAIPIQPGDTLSAIAKRYKTTVSTLQYMNGIKDPDMIYSGRTLNVPNPNYQPMAQVQQMQQRMGGMLPQGIPSPQFPRPQGRPQLPSPQQEALQSVMPESMLPMGKLAGAGMMGAGMAQGGLAALAKMAPRAMPPAGVANMGRYGALGARKVGPALPPGGVRPQYGSTMRPNPAREQAFDEQVLRDILNQR